MSAYLVSKSHIDALVALYATVRKREGSPLSPQTMNHLGSILIDANVRSIEARYPDTAGKPAEMPGPDVDSPDRAFANGYTWSPVRATVTPIGALALVQCYSYQTCEYDGFEESDAGVFCTFMTARLLARFFPGYTGHVCDLPGYESAPWGL